MSLPDPAPRSAGVGGMLRGLLLLAGLLAVRPIVRRLLGATSRTPRPRRAPRPPRVDSRAVALGHETRDVPILPVVAGVVALAVGIGAVVGVATLYQAARTGSTISLSQPPGLATPAVPAAPPEPRLEEEPGAQLRQLRAAEDQILTGTAWVDRQAGVARIPIDRAIDLLAQHPPPARSAEEASQFRDAAVSLPGAASSGRAPTGRAP